MFEWSNGGQGSDSGVQDLMEAHNFSSGVDPVWVDGAFLGLVRWQAGWQSESTKAAGLVAESDILESLGSHPSSNGPEWEPCFARNNASLMLHNCEWCAQPRNLSLVTKTMVV